jgi:hypothetical protein
MQNPRLDPQITATLDIAGTLESVEDLHTVKRFTCLSQSKPPGASEAEQCHRLLLRRKDVIGEAWSAAESTSGETEEKY